jgi:glyoxylase I family protein
VRDPGDWREVLLAYETALARRDARGTDRSLESLLADDFVEFGSSGEIWSRQMVVELLRREAPRAISLEAFSAALLSDGVALLTYRAGGSNRSSVWTRTRGVWRVRFHQGTRRQAPG